MIWFFFLHGAIRFFSRHASDMAAYMRINRHESDMTASAWPSLDNMHQCGWIFRQPTLPHLFLWPTYLQLNFILTFIVDYSKINGQKAHSEHHNLWHKSVELKKKKSPQSPPWKDFQKTIHIGVCLLKQSWGPPLKPSRRSIELLTCFSDWNPTQLDQLGTWRAPYGPKSFLITEIKRGWGGGGVRGGEVGLVPNENPSMLDVFILNWTLWAT